MNYPTIVEIETEKVDTEGFGFLEKSPRFNGTTGQLSPRLWREKRTGLLYLRFVMNATFFYSIAASQKGSEGKNDGAWTYSLTQRARAHS